MKEEVAAESQQWRSQHQQPRSPRSGPESRGESEKEEKAGARSKKSRRRKQKPVSNLARKRPTTYEQNGTARSVRPKKSENGKRNVQARAIKCGRDL